MNDCSQDLIRLFYEANSNFLKNNFQNILLNLDERNLCSLLSKEIFNLFYKYDFDSYYCDTEYNRNGNSIKTIIDFDYKVKKIKCDLIIHSRGLLEKDNLLALEMKKSTTSEKKKEEDRTRLKCLTKKECNEKFLYNGHFYPKHVCMYDVGIFYILDVKKQVITIEIYSNSELIRIETKSIDYYQSINRKEIII